MKNGCDSSQNKRNRKETRGLGISDKRFKERTFGFKRHREFDFRRGPLVCQNIQKVLLLRLKKRFIETDVSL